MSLSDFKQQRGRRKLQRLFSGFPSGLPGLGLLLLRAALGAAAILKGGPRLVASADPAMWEVVVSGLIIVCGATLIVGLLTPITSMLISLTAGGIAFDWPSAALAAVAGIAIALTGPGAYSVDAWLFGRREIIIPDSPNN